MKDIQEILNIIETGFNCNAPGDTIVSVIKNYCESVMNKYNKDMEEEYAKESKRKK